MQKHLLTLADIGSDEIGLIERRLAMKIDGSPLAATTANRFRIVARACVKAAVEAGAISGDPWPPRSRSRARRKVARVRKNDLRNLPTPMIMERALQAIETYQPASKTYRVMTAVAYYAGLRPSEVVMLRRRSATLPASGWGRLAVTEADISFDEPGEPKTGPRSVPIPPVLVQILKAWIADHAFAPDDLIFRTRSGTLPASGNWRRAWHRALASIGEKPLRIYDCRHAAATTWLRAGVPLGETARRLGHSVDTLVSTYVGALDDEEVLANARIEAVLANASTTTRALASGDDHG